MIVPPLLKQGDKVAIVAPAKKLSMAELNAAVAVVESWGLKVNIGRYVQSNDHSYLSATDEKRLSDLQDAIDDEEVRAIFCVRGGYGSTRILDHVDFTNLRLFPKWLVGFSDITAVLLAACNFGVSCIHGTMPVHFAKENWKPSVESVKRTLFEGMAEMTAASHIANRPGSATGPLIGGNLSIIADSIGTTSEIITDGCIMLLEEIDEDLYRLDRMLTHLKRTGKFDRLAGLVLGHLSDLRDTSDFQEGFESMLKDKIKSTSYPVGWNFPFGHENLNQSWILGQRATLTVNDDGARLTPH